jgi:hypothetical protein
MGLLGLSITDRKASSETLGVVVLVGMTILVTAGLGIGVMTMNQQQQEQTADIDFTFLSESLFIVYQDQTERPAGSLYIEGPNNNVSWAELSDDLGPEGMVGENSNVELQESNAYGAQPREGERFAVIYITDGERYVLDSINADAGSGQSSGSPSPGG